MAPRGDNTDGGSPDIFLSWGGGGQSHSPLCCPVRRPGTRETCSHPYECIWLHVKPLTFSSPCQPTAWKPPWQATHNTQPETDTHLPLRVYSSMEDGQYLSTYECWSCQYEAISLKDRPPIASDLTPSGRFIIILFIWQHIGQKEGVDIYLILYDMEAKVSCFTAVQQK